MKRKKTLQPHTSDEEIDKLKREKQIMMMELMKLKQGQQNTKSCLQEMKQRITMEEIKQKQLKSFFAMVLRNPTLLQKLRAKQLQVEAKKRRMMDQATQEGRTTPVVSIIGPPVGDSELDKLAVDSQGSVQTGNNPEREKVELENGDKTVLDEGVWVWEDDDFLKDEFEDDDDKKELHELVEQLREFVSTPN